MHRAEQKAESLLWLEVGSVRKMGNRDVVKKIQPPKLGCLGGPWSASIQEELKNGKMFGKARTVRDGGMGRVQGVWGSKGLPSSSWNPPGPLVL